LPTSSCSTQSRRPELPGGNGVSFDWTILAALGPDVDYMLSGGLSAANVAEALRIAGPPGIDVSSGVESAPGVKSVALIDGFLPRLTQSRRATRRNAPPRTVYFFLRKA
jgi:phosphoribosylanthranilate isomerase